MKRQIKNLKKKAKLSKIGVLTSGGDSPGMNAAIRAVVRTAIYNKLDVFGIKYGYEGLIEDKFEKMETSSVSNIIQRGGTILHTARSERFFTKEGRASAYKNLSRHNIDGLIVIGGDGTFKGAEIFSQEYEIPVIGIPGTIDNDIYGTDYTIGFDTAVNTVIEAVDKIRDTADALNRLFFVEVMGRDAGYIALYSGIASGAEDILIPETETCIDDLIAQLKKGWRQNKTSCIIIVAEGDEKGGAIKIAETVNKHFDNYETRVSILGHLQRGGSPTYFDRLLASTLGFEAVNAIIEGRNAQMAGIVNNKTVFTPFKKANKTTSAIDKRKLHMAKILSI